jgi:hypothetical protein
VKLERAEIERILAAWPVARLATLASDGRAELVPIVFAWSGGALWTPIDGEARGVELAREQPARRAASASCSTATTPTGAAGGCGSTGARSSSRAAPRRVGRGRGLRAKYPRYAGDATPLFGASRH